jgi:hypothetical protein
MSIPLLCYSKDYAKEAQGTPSTSRLDILGDTLKRLSYISCFQTFETQCMFLHSNA